MSLRLFIVALLVCSSGVAQDMPLSDKPPVVPFCELVKNPDIYDGRVVTTIANFISYLDATALTDSSCMPGTLINITTLATFGSDYKPNTPQDKKLWMLYQQFREVRVTATGRFYGPLRGPYGHNRCCRMQFEISSISDVQKLRSSRTKALFDSAESVS